MPKKTRKSCPVGKKVITRNNHRRKSCVNDYSVAFCAKRNKIYNSTSGKCRTKCKSNRVWSKKTYKGKSRERCMGNNSKASCAKLGKVYNASSNKCRDKCKGNQTYTTQTYKGKTRRRCA